MTHAFAYQRSKGADRHWKVRPYRGFSLRRVRPKAADLDVKSMVSLQVFDPAYAATLTSDVRALYVKAGEKACSVAELSAASGMPLGVTRIVVDELAAQMRLTVHAEPGTDLPDRLLLERVLGGLRRLQ